MTSVIVKKSCAAKGWRLIASPDPQEVPDELIPLLGDAVERESGEVESSTVDSAELDEIVVDQPKPKRKRKAATKANKPRKSRKKKGE